MTMNKAYQCLFLLLICLLPLMYGADFDPELTKIGKSGEPGAKMRLTTTGLAYIREIVMRVINHELPLLKFPMITAEIKPEGSVKIMNMKVIDYWAPTEYNLDMGPPDKFSWSMVNMGIRTAGDFDGETKAPVVGIPIKVAGTFDALIAHMAYSMTIKLSISSDGFPMVAVDRCSMVVDDVDLVLKGENFIATALNLFKSVIADQVKPTLQTQVCARVTELINVDVNKMLATLPLKIPLSATRVNGDNSTDTAIGRRKKRAKESTFDYYNYETDAFGFSNEKIDKVIIKIDENEYKEVDLGANDFASMIDKIRSKNLVIDLRLLKAPLIALGHAFTQHRGEISWQGNGGTPFYPAVMADVATTGSHMLQLYINDYIANSLLYHAYKHQILNGGVSANDSENLNSLLRTTCKGASVCIGDLLTGIADQFPNHVVDMLVTPYQAPLALIGSDGVTVSMNSKLELYVRRDTPGSTLRLKALEANLTLTALVRLGFSDNAQRIGGEVQITKLELLKVYSRLPTTTQSTLDDMASLSKGMISKMASGILQKGIPLPKIKGLEFRSPRLLWKKNYALVETYFTIDEEYVSKIIADATNKIVAKQGGGG